MLRTCICVRVQALLEEWRTELARKPLAMSEQEACSVLGVQADNSQDAKTLLSEDALKAAYRCICHAWQGMTDSDS